MKALKLIGRLLVTLLLLVILTVGGYVLYLVFQYHRIADNRPLAVRAGADTALTGKTFTVGTYNLGFGAYDQAFTFFMDKGEMKDGTKTAGVGSRASSKEAARQNTDGAIASVKTDLGSPDFMFFQEVDENADRSHGVNQRGAIETAFDAYAAAYASNFHSGYLFYPVTNPHGSVNSGILTLSKYKVRDAVRRSFPVDESFPTKFFDLDRCFTVTTVSVEAGKNLILINVHLSAYDKGGAIRAKQLGMLKAAMAEAYDNGKNYVIVGGDFNHDIVKAAAGERGKDSLSEGNGGLADLFPSDQKKPDWVRQMTIDDLDDGGVYRFAAAENFDKVPTCRATDIAYQKKPDGSLVNYSVIIDGFIVSKNIEFDKDDVKNIDNDFRYSDHQPVWMRFSLV